MSASLARPKISRALAVRKDIATRPGHDIPTIAEGDIDLNVASFLRQLRLLVAVDSQCGQVSGVTSSLRGRGRAPRASPELSAGTRRSGSGSVLLGAK